MTQAALAEAMAQRKHVNEMCNNRRSVTAATGAHLRPRVRQQPRLLAQRAAAHRSLGGVEQSRERERTERAKLLGAAA
ncbi:MAG TPA: addiction module antidote protein, HigA family [Rhizomicrobium sp.]